MLFRSAPLFLPPTKNMSSIKCPTCGLVNWNSSPTCKRCQNSLQVAPGTGVPDLTTAPVYTTPDLGPSTLDRGGEHFGYRENAAGPKLKTGLAQTGMILGIVSVPATLLLIGVAISPIALILSIVGLVKASNNPRVYGGKGFAIIGVCVSAFALLFVTPFVAAIAVPNFYAAARSANEASAIAALKSLNMAQQTFMRSPEGNGNCGEIAQLSRAKLIRPELAATERNGYKFSVKDLHEAGICEIHAVPLSKTSGKHSFMITSGESVVHFTEKEGSFASAYDLTVDGRREKIGPVCPDRYEGPNR